MITEKQMEKIKNFAINLDWNLAFDGKSRGNQHLKRVVNKAKELAKNYNVDISIVEAGAWLHDTNLEKTISGDTLANKDKVISFLEEIDLDESDIEKVLHCIEAHDGKIKAESIEAKIVHDADTLEKMGPLGIIREAWKCSQIGWATEKIAAYLPSHLEKRKSNLYTEFAKTTGAELGQPLTEFFQVLEKQLIG